MSDSIIERAARKLARHHGGLLAGTGPDSPEAKYHADQRWKEYVPDVHTVLEAIREPSVEMVLASYEREPNGEEKTGAACWQAMIDAALEER